MLARLAVLSVCLVLAACATPADVKAGGDHGSLDAQLPVAKTAHCLQSGFENIRYDMQTRLTADDDRTEIIVRYDYGTLGVMEIRPAAHDKSTVEYWIGKGEFRPDPPALLAGMLARCR